MSYQFYSVKDELELYVKNTAAINAVLQKYPDAGKMYYPYPNMSILESGDFYSPSIIYDDVKLDMSTGVWFNFSVIPYVDVPYEFGIIPVFNKPRSFDVFLLNYDFKESTAIWGNIEQEMLKAGYKKELLKLIYDQVLLLLAKDTVSNVTMIREGMPEYILNYLPFI